MKRCTDSIATSHILQEQVLTIFFTKVIVELCGGAYQLDILNLQSSTLLQTAPVHEGPWKGFSSKHLKMRIIFFKLYDAMYQSPLNYFNNSNFHSAIHRTTIYCILAFLEFRKLALHI